MTNSMVGDGRSGMDDARAVFDFYLAAGCKKLKRFETWEPKIVARLKNYTVDDLKTCIEHLAASQWHRENGWQGLEQVVDSDMRVEKWLAWQPRTRPSLHIEAGKSYDRKADNE